MHKFSLVFLALTYAETSVRLTASVSGGQKEGGMGKLTEGSNSEISDVPDWSWFLEIGF